MTIYQRVEEVLEQLRENLGFKRKTDFYEHLGWKYSNLSNWKSRGGKPSFDFFYLLLQADKTVNCNYIISGEGPIFLSPNTLSISESIEKDSLIDRIKELEEKNTNYEEKLVQLEDLFQQLKDTQQKTEALLVANFGKQLSKSDAGKADME